LITASPQADSLPSADGGSRSSRVSAFRPASPAMKPATASSSLIGYQIAKQPVANRRSACFTARASLSNSSVASNGGSMRTSPRRSAGGSSALSA